MDDEKMANNKSLYHDVIIMSNVKTDQGIQPCLFRVSVDKETGNYATDRPVKQVHFTEPGARKAFFHAKDSMVFSTLPTQPELEKTAGICYLLNTTKLEYYTRWNESGWSSNTANQASTSTTTTSPMGDVYIALTDAAGKGKMVQIKGEAIQQADQNGETIKAIEPNPGTVPAAWRQLRNGAVVSQLPSSDPASAPDYLVNLNSLVPTGDQS